MAELNILRTRCVSAELEQRLAGVETDLDDGLVPAAGEALYYVVVAANCAGESILGSGRTAASTCP